MDTISGILIVAIGVAVVFGAWVIYGSRQAPPEENWKPAPAAVCDVTAERHPTQLRCEWYGGAARGWTCGAVGDRRDP